MTMESSGKNLLPLMFGQITRIVDPSDFWLQIGSEADLSKVKTLEEQISLLAPTLSVGDVNSIVEDTIVVVQLDSRNLMRWKRAKVLRVDRQKNAFDVLYIDYGNTEIVPASSVRWNLPAEIQEHPCDCYRCALAGIQPIAKSWTRRGIKTFQKLVSHGTFKVAIVVYDHVTLKHRVNLYPIGDSSLSIAHQMLNAETGLPTEERVQEYLKDVILVSCEEVYGASMAATGQDLEEESERTNCGETFPEETEESSQSWATCSESSTSFPQDQVEGADNTIMDRDAAGQMQQVPYTGGGSSMSQNVSQEKADHVQTESAGESTQEQTEAVSESAAVVVPGFNISGLQQRRMLSAQELQKEQEERQQALRRARLQKDMMECNRDMEHLQLSTGQGQTWGNSDLLLVYGVQRPVTPDGRSPQNRGARAGVGDVEGSEDGNWSTNDFNQQAHISLQMLYPEDKGLKQQQEYTHENVSGWTRSTPAKKDVGEIFDREGYKEDVPVCEDTAPRKSLEKDEEFSNDDDEGDETICQEPGAAYFGAKPLYTLLPPPEPHPSWTAEEIEYRIHEYIRKMLGQVVQMDNVLIDAVCACVHCLAPLDPNDCGTEMKAVLEALLHEAVQSEVVRELALQVFSSYFGVIRGEVLFDTLKNSAEKFVKLPMGSKPPRYHDFIDVMIQLLYQTFDWPLLNTVIQDFILNCLEKWIIFNKRGIQTGLLQLQQEEMYVACAENLLPVSISILQVHDPEKTSFIVDQMREKVLETDVDYSVRSRLLTLLLKCPQSDSIQASDAKVCAKKSTHEQAVQTDSSLPHPPHGPSCSPQSSEGSPKKGSGLAEDRGMQTESVEKEGTRRWNFDAMVQTEPLEALRMPRRSSVGSLDSSTRSLEDLDSIVSVPGRARRRRALLEHFNRQKQGPGEEESVFLQADGASTVSSAGFPLTDSMNSAPRNAGITHQTHQSCLPVGDKENVHKGQLPNQDIGPERTESESSKSSQDMSSASFMSAMVSVSQAAYSTVFGHHGVSRESGTRSSGAAYGEDAEQRTLAGSSNVDASPQEGDPSSKEDSSVHFLGDSNICGTHLSGTENFCDRKEVTHDKVSRENSDDFTDASQGTFSGQKSFPSKRAYSESVKGSWRGGEMRFSPKDFPSLPSQPVHIDGSSSEQAPLSLHSIADDVLQTPERHFNVGSEDRETKDCAPTRSRETLRPGVDHNEIYISEEDDRGSVPSDWEDRFNSLSVGTSPYLPSADQAADTEGGHHITGQGGQGDWLEGQSVVSRHHGMDPAGDSSTSWLSQSPHPKIAQDTAWPTLARGLDAGDTGRGMSPAGSDGDSVSGGSMGSSSTPPSGGAVPYQRGDLASMMEGSGSAKGKGRKKKFRPFNPIKPSPPPTSPREFVPCKVCSNCNEMGHTRDQCPKPLKSILF